MPESVVDGHAFFSSSPNSSKFNWTFGRKKSSETSPKRYTPVSRLTEEQRQRKREMDRERQRRRRERIKAATEKYHLYPFT